MEKLLKRINETFGDVKVVPLGELCKKIAIVSKVRIGDEGKRVDTPYEEVSLSDLDTNQIIHPPKKKNDLGLANGSALKNQRLKKGDLLISNRGLRLEIGLYDGRYDDRILIGKNSMIRIQFEENKNITTPLYVKNYLFLPYVQRYIFENDCKKERLKQSSSFERKIISSAELMMLPIPYFEEYGDPSMLEKIYYKGRDICGQISTIEFKVREAYRKCYVIREKTLISYLETDNENLLENLKKYDLFLKRLERFETNLCELFSDLNP